MILAQSRDVSSGGFYCLSGESLKPGEILNCVITLLPVPSHKKSRPVMLNCKVEVMRVEQRQPGFGLACQIHDFSLQNRS